MSTSRPRLAGVTTRFFKYSHTQHIIDRFLDGYGWNGTHHHPEMDLVSLYVDQVREILREGQTEGSLTLVNGQRLKMSKIGWKSLLAVSRA